MSLLGPRRWRRRRDAPAGQPPDASQARPGASDQAPDVEWFAGAPFEDPRGFAWPEGPVAERPAPATAAASAAAAAGHAAADAKAEHPAPPPPAPAPQPTSQPPSARHRVRALLEGRDGPGRLVAAVCALGVLAGLVAAIVALAGGLGGSSGPASPSAFTVGFAGTGNQTLLGALASDLQPSGPAAAATQPAQVTLPISRAVAQLFLVGFGGIGRTAPILGRLHYRDWGGVVLDGNNFVDTGQLAHLALDLDRSAVHAGDTPLLVAARQVGGSDSALPGLPPPDQATQAAGGPTIVRREAERAAHALRTLHLNMTLAPDADLDYQGGPSGGDSFGTDPTAVSHLVLEALRGYRAVGLIPVVGSFPGEGAASQDPSLGTATVGLTLGMLRQRDLVPFVAAIPVAPVIQMSDALFTALDPVTPATVSPVSVKLLRHRLHYTGVIMTGDLAAVTAATGTSVGQAAVAALKAGADLLYVSGNAADQEQAYDQVLHAVQDGAISRQTLAVALSRVLGLKRGYGLLTRP